MTIRKMRKGDIEKVAKLHNELNMFENKWAPLSNEFLKLKTSLRIVKGCLKHKLNKIIVAEDKGEIIGFILYNIRPKGKLFKEDYIYIEDLYISEEYRKKGVAKKLMKEIEKIAKIKKIYILRVGSDIRNRTANSMYNKLNYDKEGYEWIKDLK